MHDIILIGFGNVGQSLFKGIQETHEFRVRQIFVRNKDHADLPTSVRVTDNLQALESADLYIVCVTDDAIEEISKNLPFNDRLVVHTSGSSAVSSLKDQTRAGVFYPLQSFSRSKEVNWKEVPLCLETTLESDLTFLKKLGRALSDKVYAINSEQRKKLHLAAVVANNFTNHLYFLAESICKDHNIPFEVLHPLILETATKIQSMTPYEAQTGPARRNDQKTLNSQLQQVEGTALDKIYKLLTASIASTYEREKL
ncbi:DUF2520 domain-containing protein [Robertkochia marina]|uniref:DUF2520 domain-containing protein n=1 Tax=Robertkochia marina TaxID=1227945 RepID=A0A4S3LZM3_9FLAO|nr:DUF2520 domain-containing protein [Robertkochia marina]THD67531.1 DUF2520 domain-containing protein [Robertkochia marina]TRZ44602.1 DUF2520 domain-containing protein [Robertkochia marina]